MSSLSGQTRSTEVALDLLSGQDDIGEPGSIRKALFGNEDVLVLGSRNVLTVAAIVLSIHAMASLVFPAHGSVSYLGIGACSGVAGFAAYTMSLRTDGVMHIRWRLLVLGFCFGVFTNALTLYQECILRTPSSAAGIQDVALLLRGVPFLAAVCLSKRELGPKFAAMDFAQVGLVAFLASFALLFTGPRHLPVSSDAALFWIITANVLIASLASVRCVGGVDGEERHFFRLVAGFLWANTVATGLLNFHGWARGPIAPGSALYLVCDVPLLGLTVMLVGLNWSLASKGSGTEEATFVDALCSLFLPICSLLLAASIVPSHPGLGLGGVVVGFVLYGLRSTVVLKKSLEAQHELLLANKSIQDQVFSDGLTGIPNRRNFDLTLEREWKRAQRSRQPLALLMLDVDHFKSLNDELGHPTGDRCLREIAGVVRAGLGREADFAARYGGEEFAVLLVDTGIDGARIVGESLRRAVEQHRCVLDDGTGLCFTVSVGVAAEVPMLQESSMTLLAAADKALYRAKRSGRNRVESHMWQTNAVST